MARSSAQCKDGPRGLGDQCCYIVNCSYHSNEGWRERGLSGEGHIVYSSSFTCGAAASSEQLRTWAHHHGAFDSHHQRSSDQCPATAAAFARSWWETRDRGEFANISFQLSTLSNALQCRFFYIPLFIFPSFHIQSLLIIHLIWWSDGRSCCNENALKLDLNTLAIFLALFVR